MKIASRRFLFLFLLSFGSTTLAGDMLKPWASVISGPDRPPGYHWTYESFEYESDCKKENAYQLAKLEKPSAPPASTKALDQDTEISIQLPLASDPDGGSSVVSHAPVTTTMACVYHGSKYQIILRLRNFRNAAVLCIAKEKKFRDYRVVLAGAPRETDEYRCD